MANPMFGLDSLRNSIQSTAPETTSNRYVNPLDVSSLSTSTYGTQGIAEATGTTATANDPSFASKPKYGATGPTLKFTNADLEKYKPAATVPTKPATSTPAIPTSAPALPASTKLPPQLQSLMGNPHVMELVKALGLG